MKKFLSSGVSFALLLSFGVFFVSPSSALAASAGPNNAGAATSVTGVGTVAWTSAGNITTAGSPYATAVLGTSAVSNYLQATGYNFSIPANATINGVQVSVNRMSSSNSGGNSIQDNTVKLVKGGVISGNNKASITDWPIAFGSASYGATNDLWGVTLTPADVNASNFGVALAVENQSTFSSRTASVDTIQITITYTLPTTTIGDGTSPANKTVVPSATNKAVSAFTLATNTGSDTVTGLVVTGTNTANVAASGVKIYQDNGTTPNEWDASDTLKGTASFSGTTATFSGLSIPVTTTATQYLVTYDISASPTNGQTMTGVVTGVTATNTVSNGDTTDATLTIDSAAPALSSPVAITTPTADATPNFGFTSTEAGTLTFGGSCNTGIGGSTTAVAGSNTVTLPLVTEGAHADCTVTVTDAVGNASTPLAIPSFTVDVTAPSVVITQAAGQTDPTTGTTINFTATFSEAVTGFISSDVTVGGTAGGTKTATVTGSGSVYNIAIALTGVPTSGTVTATIAAAKATDLAGNNNTASINTDNSVQYDAPTYTVTASETGSGSITPSGAVSVSQGANQTFTLLPFSSNILSSLLVDGVAQSLLNSYTLSSVVAAHTIAATFDGGWSAPAAFTFAGASGSVTTPNNASVSDNLYAVFDNDNDVERFGNFNLSVPAGATINGIEVAIEGYRDSGATPRTFATNLSWNNGANAATAKSGTDLSTTEKTVVLGTTSDKWGSHTWVPADFNNGNFTVTVDPIAANGNLNIDQLQVKVFFTPDTTAPVLAQVTPVTHPTNDNTPNYTFSSTEAGTISYGGSCASATTVAVAGNNTITFNTLADGTYSDCTITVTDVAGNPSAALAVNTFTVDTNGPSVTLSSVANAVINAAFSVTATFTETVNNFVQGDISVSGGSVSNFVPVSGTVYTFTVTPSGDGTVSVNIPGAVATDAAGNNNTAATTLSRVYDTTAPVTTINSHVDGDAVSVSAGATTKSNSMTLGFSATDINTVAETECDLDNGGFALCASPKTYNSLSDGSHTVSVRSTDAVGNVEVAKTFTWIVDTTAPVITLTGLSDISVAYGIGYSDEGATTNDPAVPTATASGATVTATSPVGDYVITYNASDAVGNAAAPVTRTIHVTKASSVTTVTCPASETYTGSAIETCSASYTTADGTSGNLDVDYTTNINVGTAHASASYAGDTNHSESSDAKTFTITAKGITVTADPQSKVYGESDPTLTYVSSDNAAPFTGTLSRDAGETVGTYPITIGDLSAGDNYDITFVSADLTITKAASTVTVTCPVTAQEYTGEAQTPCTVAIEGVNLSTTATPSYTNNVNVGTATASYTYAGDANHTGNTGSANFTIGKKAASVTPNAHTKVFGDTDPTLDGTLSGFVAGDNVTATYSRALGEDVNTYTISAELSPVDVLGNYDITYGTADFTITKAPTVTTLTCSNVTYNGLAQEPCSAVVTGPSGLDQPVAVVYTSNTAAGTAHASATYAGDDNYASSVDQKDFTIGTKDIHVTADAKSKVYGAGDPSLTYTADPLASGDSFTGALDRAAGETVGTHAITQGTLALSDNYNLIFTGADLTITPAELTITASNDTMVYGGTVPTITPAYSGFVNGDVAPDTAPTCSTTATSASIVGSYTSSCTGAVDTDYTISYVDGSVSVTKAPLSVQADDKSKVYGEANPTFTGVITGILNSDDITASYGTTADASSPVGTYAIVPLLSGAALTNYDAPTVTNGTLTVTDRAITVTADDLQTKVYGDSDAAFTYQITSGTLASGDSFDGALTRAVGENVGTYAITQGTLALPASYTLTFVSKDFSITPRPITVTAQTNTKVYDGTKDAAALPLITSGELKFTDTATLTEEYADKNVGTNKTLIPTATVLDGNSGNNYTVTLVNDTTGAITAPSALTVTGITAGDKIYDQGTNAALNTSSAALVGVASSDDVSLDLSGVSGSFADKNVGAGKSVTISGLLLTGADAANYSLTAPVVTASITAKTLAVTATADNKIYDGNTTAVTHLTDDRIAGDVFDVTNSAADFDTATVGVGKTVTVSGIALTGADALNYAANTSTTATADITSATGSVVISDLAQTYDGTPKAVTTATTPVGLTVDVTYDNSATVPTAAGSYTVVATINDTNYTGTDTKTLVIAKAANAITFGALGNKNFGDADFDVAATATSGNTPTFTASGSCTVTGATVHITGTGSCTITAHDAESANYSAAADAPQSFTIADNAAPVISGTPTDMLVEATSNAGAVATYTDPTAVDDVDGSVVPVCTPASGSTFAFGETTVTCTATDSATNASHTSFKVTVVDTTKPVITLGGTTPLTIEKGSTYTDAGATASDTVDGDLTSAIGITGSVNTALVGDYVLTYNVSDAHNNAADAVTRTVHVVDTAAPVITIDPYTTTLTNQDVVVTASTNEGTLNATSHTFTANGSFDFVATDGSGNTATSTVTITNIDKEAPVITLTGSTPVDVSVGGSYVDAGATATDNVDVTVTVHTSGSVDTNTVGAYVLTYSATDAAGNAAAPVTRTVNVNALPLPLSPIIDTHPDVATTSLAFAFTFHSSEGGVSFFCKVDGDPYTSCTSPFSGTTNIAAHTFYTVAVSNAGTSTPATFDWTVNEVPAPIITGEATSTATQTSMTITWTTDHPATSRVVYDTSSHNPAGAAPSYGYAFSTIEDATLTTLHSVVVNGLTAGTEYFFRAVSHGSPEAISTEITGSTLDVVVPPVDVCANIEGNQSEAPVGTHIDGANCVPDQVPPTDVCANIDGVQTEAPIGTHIDGANCVADEVVPPTQVQVHIYKYLDGSLANAESASGYTFPMHAVWTAANLNAGAEASGDYVLGNNHGGAPDLYGANTSMMDAHANYTTNEITSDADETSSVLPASAQCIPGKYRLIGYSKGTTKELAVAAGKTTVAPIFDDLVADQYVIVWNEKCVDVTPPPVDVCANIDGLQTEAPVGTHIEGANCVDNVPPPVDLCPNIAGDQSSIPEGYELQDGQCVQIQTPLDVCTNLAGNQTTVPEGYEANDGICTLISNNSCPLPDALGDVTVETVKMNTGEELNLQAILDDAGNSLNVQSDQQQTQVWNVYQGSTLNIDATHIDNLAGLSSVFGYYTGSDLSTFVPLFKTANITGYASVPLASAGQVSVSVPVSGHVGFAIKLYNGNSYVGTRATENALNQGGADKAVVYNTSANTYALAFEDATDNDFNDLVVEVQLSCGGDEGGTGNQCELDETHTVVLSDGTTTVNGLGSEILGFIHANWTAVIADADWIWGEEPVIDPVHNTTETFMKTFTVSGTPTGATLHIAADNTYKAYVNNTLVCSSTAEDNYRNTTQDTCTVAASALVSGENTLKIEVTNIGTPNATAHSNPAGLLYSLDVASNSCTVPPQEPVDVCANIAGTQTSVPNGMHAEGNQCVADQVAPVDVCPNIEGIQAELPSGKQITDGQCVDIPSGNSGNNENSGGNNNTPAPQSVAPQSGGGGNGPIAGSFGGNGIVLGEQTTNLPELPASCSALLHTYMRMGKQNDTEEVKKLQNFLNQYMNSGLPVNGVFGPMTDKAVRDFQRKHTPQVLTPWKIETSTGYVYKTTQRWINLVQCSTLDIPMPDLY